ncbi:MAG: glycosyltransferase family 39 protein [Acidimicrobiia bacterium]
MSTTARSTPRRAGADPSATAHEAIDATAGHARRFAASAAAIVAVALTFRLIRLGVNSFWIDEINVLSFVRSGHLLTDLRGRGGPFEPPLHYLAVWAALRLPVGFETAARVPAALFGTLEVVAVIGLVRRLTGRDRLALWAGALLAVAPFAIRYSQENRYYTTFSALHLVSWWLLVRALQRRQVGDFVAWGASLALLLLAHPFAPLVVLVQVAGALWWVRRTERRGLADHPARTKARVRLGAAVALALALPWFLWGAIRWVPDLLDGRSYALNSPGRAKVALTPELFKHTFEWLLGDTARLTPLVLLLAGFAVAAPFVVRRPLRGVTRGIAVYTLGFFVLLVPLAWTLRTPLAVRRVEFLLAPVVMLAVLGIDGVGAWLAARHHARAVRIVTHLVPVLVVALSVAATIAYFTTEKTQYRALAAVVAAAPAKDLVVIGPIDERWQQSIRSYLSWRHVRRHVTFVVAGHPPPKLRRPAGRVVWITPSPPYEKYFTSRSLNSLPDMQVIAADRTAPDDVLPWFVAVTSPTTDRALQRELRLVSTVAVNLPPPAGSPFPWWTITGR